MYKPGERPPDKAGQNLVQEAASSSEASGSSEAAPAAAAAVAHKAENMDGDEVAVPSDGGSKDKTVEKKSERKSDDASDDQDA